LPPGREYFGNGGGVTAASKNDAPPRLALRIGEASASLGISPESFARYVEPHVRWTRVGSLKLVAVAELERWLAETGSFTLEPAE
jgi:hypothetical protein